MFSDSLIHVDLLEKHYIVKGGLHKERFSEKITYIHTYTTVSEEREPLNDFMLQQSGTLRLPAAVICQGERSN